MQAFPHSGEEELARARTAKLSWLLTSVAHLLSTPGTEEMCGILFKKCGGL